MKLPNWFKIVWWASLLVLVTQFLYQRHPELVQGHETRADVFVFLVWVALALVPVFQEINFFGIKLKQEVRKLRKEVGMQIATLRAEVQNSVQFKAQVNPQFTITQPPTDAQLPQLEEQVGSAIDAALAARGLTVPTAKVTQPTIDAGTAFLFQARYSIERELRRIWNERFGEGPRRILPIRTITNELSRSGLVDPDLANAIQEVYSVCSPAIHGELPTAAQTNFVRDLLPRLLTALRAVQ